METLSLLFKVLWSPYQTLRSVSERPRIVAPLLLLTLIAGVETALVFAVLDPGELRLQQFEREGYADKISDSDKAVHAQSARNNRLFAGAITTMRAVVIVFVVASVFYLCLGAWRGVSWRAFLAVTAFAFIPSIFHSVAIVVTVLLLEPTPATLQLAGSISPILLLNPSSVPQGVYFALSMVDVVSIWILALLVIGYGCILQHRVNPILRFGAVAGVYCVWTGVYVAIRLTLA